MSNPNQVSRSDLRDLLLQCCADEAADVRQSALALLGDLAKVRGWETVLCYGTHNTVIV